MDPPENDVLSPTINTSENSNSEPSPSKETNNEKPTSKTQSSLVCYDVSSGSEDELEIPVFEIKEEPKDIENEMEDIEVSDDESMDEVEEENPLELIPPVTNVQILPADKEEIVVLNNYRDQQSINISSDSDTDSSSDSSSESDDQSSESSVSLQPTNIVETKAPETSKAPPEKKKKATFEDDFELPPIEDLHISVEETEAKLIGTICQIVDTQVVVQSYPDIPAIDLDSVLFLDVGKRALGKVFDVFGPIQLPLYVVRFNSSEHVKEKEVLKGAPVYFAPQTEHTSYVILNELLIERGSDASWKDNREPPDKYLEYSDDEEERKAKQARKQKATKEPQIISEFESSVKKVRNDRRNPFSANFNSRGTGTDNGRSSSTQYGRGSYQRAQNGGVRSDSRGNVQFGGPPMFRPPMSPCPPFSPSPYPRSYNSSPHYFCSTPPPPIPTPPPPSIPTPPPPSNFNAYAQNNSSIPHMMNQGPHAPPFSQSQAPPPTHMHNQAPPPPHIQSQAPPPHMHNQAPPPPIMHNQAPPHMPNQAPPPPHMPNQAPPPPHMHSQAPPPPHMQNQAPPPPNMPSQAPPPSYIHNQAPPPPQMLNQAAPHYIHGQAPPPQQMFGQAPPPQHMHGQAPPPQHMHGQAPPPQHMHGQAPPPQHMHGQTPPHQYMHGQAPPHQHMHGQAPPPPHAPPPSPQHIPGSAPPQHIANQGPPSSHFQTMPPPPLPYSRPAHPPPPLNPNQDSYIGQHTPSIPNLSVPPPHLSYSHTNPPHN